MDVAEVYGVIQAIKSDSVSLEHPPGKISHLACCFTLRYTFPLGNMLILRVYQQYVS